MSKKQDMSVLKIHCVLRPEWLIRYIIVDVVDSTNLHTERLVYCMLSSFILRFVACFVAACAGFVLYDWSDHNWSEQDALPNYYCYFSSFLGDTHVEDTSYKCYEDS